MRLARSGNRKINVRSTDKSLNRDRKGRVTSEGEVVGCMRSSYPRQERAGDTKLLWGGVTIGDWVRLRSGTQYRQMKPDCNAGSVPRAVRGPAGTGSQGGKEKKGGRKKPKGKTSPPARSIWKGKKQVCPPSTTRGGENGHRFGPETTNTTK